MQAQKEEYSLLDAQRMKLDRIGSKMLPKNIGVMNLDENKQKKVSGKQVQLIKQKQKTKYSSRIDHFYKQIQIIKEQLTPLKNRDRLKVKTQRLTLIYQLYLNRHFYPHMLKNRAIKQAVLDVELREQYPCYISICSEDNVIAKPCNSAYHINHFYWITLKIEFIQYSDQSQPSEMETEKYMSIAECCIKSVIEKICE